MRRHEEPAERYQGHGHAVLEVFAQVVLASIEELVVIEQILAQALRLARILER